MITVNSAIFYENAVTSQNREVSFSGEYTNLYFDKYPVTTDIKVFAIDLHIVGDLDGYFYIKVIQGEETVHHTALSHLRVEGGGEGKDIGFIGNLEKVTFPKPGTYRFDIIFDNAVLYSSYLELIQSQKSKSRKRH